jgi:hypothetical protein
MMDISERELIDYLNSDDDLDRFLRQLEPAAARRLKSFFVCAFMAAAALSREEREPPPSNAARAAQAGGCTATAVRVVLSRRGARVTRARAPRLRVGCAQTGSGMQVTVRARRRGARLRRAAGPRLRFAVARGSSDTRQDGERLTVTTLEARR